MKNFLIQIAKSIAGSEREVRNCTKDGVGEIVEPSLRLFVRPGVIKRIRSRNNCARPSKTGFDENNKA